MLLDPAPWFRRRLRDAVFGLQDGLISTFGALIGVAAGSGDRSTVVMTGCVIVAVESLSMAAGSYLSSKSQRQYFEKLLKDEREAIETDPEGERREVRLFYAARGYTPEEIDIVEARLFSDKEVLLEDMAHKELGICPAALEDPAGNGLVMGLSYILGGLIPLTPYFFLKTGAAMPVSGISALLFLFTLGSLKGRLVGDKPWRSGVEMLVVAGAAALAGYVVGHFFSQ